MRVARPLVLVLATTALLAAALTPVASATILERGRYSGTDDWVDTDCGFPVSVHAEFSGMFSTRVGKNDDASAFFAADNYTWTETHTDQATGDWYTLSGNGMWREIRGTRLHDNVFAFDQVEAGQPFVVTNSAGKVVLRDRGSLVWHYAVDTLGDDVPGGEFVDFYGVDIHAPHPGFNTDLCKIQGQLFAGTGSAAYATPRPAGTTGANLGYYEYLPPSYSAGGTKSPLIVFLHGYGESGDGSAAELANITGGGIPYFIGNNGWPTSRPFVVLAPQHPFGDTDPSYPDCEPLPWPGSCWMASQYAGGDPPGSPFMGANQVKDFITYAVSHYNVDPHRVYLTGLSAGGYGTWAYAAHWASTGQVAAMVPISADGRPAWDDAGCTMAIPAWAFHGEQDDVINPLGSSDTIAHLAACPGAEAHLTTYPDLYHEPRVWNGTYNTLQSPVDIYAWFLAHQTS